MFVEIICVLLTERRRLEIVWFQSFAQTGLPTTSWPHTGPGSFWISTSRETPKSLWKLCQCFVTLTARKPFLKFRGKLLFFSLCLLPLVLSITEQHWRESLASFSLNFPFRYSYKFMRSPSNLFRLHIHISQPFFIQEVIQSLSILVGFFCTLPSMRMSLFLLEFPELDTALQVCPQQCWAEKNLAPSPCWQHSS